jgi:hypothetical protein
VVPLSALFASACLLVALLLLLFPIIHPEIVHGELQKQEEAGKRDVLDSLVFKASDFTATAGQIDTVDQVLRLLALHGNRAVISTRTNFIADDYPFVELEVSGAHPGVNARFFWRSGNSPRQYRGVSLPKLKQSGAALNLAGQEGWGGRIVEIGILVTGNLRNTSLGLEQIEMRPYSNWALLKVVWSEWLSFDTWKQSSINVIGRSAARQLVPLPLAVAAWGLLAALIVWLVVARQTRSFVASLVIVFFGSWLVVDAFWQYRLVQQLNETRFLFAGKSGPDKRRADWDGVLYDYANHLSEHLPETSSRIFLIHDNEESEIHDFERLRLQYHLLPHNVHNFWRHPDKRYIRPGEHILVLGRIRALRYDASSRQLIWGEGFSLPVQRLDRHKLGALYRVRGAG